MQIVLNCLNFLGTSLLRGIDAFWASLRIITHMQSIARHARSKKQSDLATHIDLLKTVLWASSVLMLGSTTASAAVITLANWDFTGQSGSGPYSPTSGSQVGTATLTGSGTFSLNTSGTVNGGAVLPYLDYTSSGGGSFTLHLTGTALSGFSVTYLGERTTGAGGGQTWAWRAGNSGAFTDLTTQPTALSGTFTSRTADFSGIGALNGQTDVYLRLTFSDKEAFDNIQVSAVPEPIHYGLAAFAMLALVAGISRRIYVQVRG